MDNKRVKRLNSLLKEVLSEVIHRDVRNPHITSLTTITEVDISKDLRHAKVHISVIGTDIQKKDTLKALKTAAGFISCLASKKVVLRYFPSLTFFLDTTVDKQVKIDSLLHKIQKEKDARHSGTD